MKRSKLTFILCVFLVASFGALAQETTADMHGTVTDGHSPLGGATVVAIHTPTGTRYSTTSRGDGRYNFGNLRVGGPYTVTVTFVGFKEEKQDNISLLLGQDYKADFTMASDATQLTEVVVKGSRQNKVFNNSRTGTQEIITRDQIDKLPTINRSLQDFTKLEPTSNGLNIGGRSSQYNNMTVDGANFNNSFGLSSVLGGQTGAQPISLDAIDQIQVNVSPFDVRQGGFSGTGINTITKSGTNQFRGSAYTYLKGAGTQGYKVENTVAPKTPITFNIRGFSAGGPIIKNKLFFFVSGEQVRQSLPASSIIASDASHAPVPNSVSQANADTLTALANFLRTKYGYDPGVFQGYSFKTNSDKITAKIDWNIDNKSVLTVKYNYLKSSSDQFASTSRPAGTAGGQPGTFAMPFNGSGYVINNNFNIIIAELNTRINNKLSNKLQAGYTALRDFRSPHSGSTTFPLVDILNNGNIYTTFGYEPYTYNNLLNTDVYQLSDVLSIYKGAHELTIGTQNYYRKYKNAFAPGYAGAYQFNSLTDFYNSANDGLANAKSYYLQYSALKDGSFPFAYAGSTELGLFLQDKWRATRNFTLTYGVRFDYTIYKETFTDNPDFDALTFKDGAQYNIGKAPTNNMLISPRVGFNWDVKGDKTTQLRGGVGVFAGAPPFVWISNQASNNGIQFGAISTSNVAFNEDPASTVSSGAANTSYGAALVSKNFKYPTTMKSSIAVDHKLPGNWIITGEFSYGKDINAVYYSNINLNETNGFAISNGADSRIRYNNILPTSASSPITNSSNKYYYTGASLQDPNIANAILMDNTSKGHTYTATARIQKTFKNLFVSLAYSYSDSRNTAEFGSTASSLWSARAVSGDPNAATVARSGFYQPHRVVAYASYKFEYAKYFSTSIGAVFEAAPSGAASYVYNGDLNGDGNTGNDLMYIPKSASDIALIDVGSYNYTTHTGTTTGTAADPRTASQIWTQLNNFIGQNHYLNFHRGEYAQANAAVFPFYKKLDLNITQNFSVKAGDNRHTLSLTFDLINAGNFLNRNWGLIKVPSVTNFLKFEGIAADGKTPLFSFPFADAGSLTPYVNSYNNYTGITPASANNPSTISRWQMQFGIRYSFN